jgi:predicted phosphodiesterase
MACANEILTWLHIGDLHITEAGERNYSDLKRLVGLVRDLPPGSLDFAVLPGDNADDGTPEQFRLVRDAIAALPVPLHILAGDHDFKPRSLDAFHDVLGAERLPKAITVHGHRCLFLDVVSAGTGGPDFRLADAQLDWIEGELREAAAAGQNVVVFMHTYPADLRAGADRLRTLLAQPHVACVDMGHTHYNEIANDGRTIFMATRSTGQIEEGPSGFSVACVDEGGVGWRFKPLDHAWPCVVITSPVDRRLVTGAGNTVSGPFNVRAKIIGNVAIHTVELRLDDGNRVPMTPIPGGAGLWEGSAAHGSARIAVRARDAAGRTDEDQVEPAPSGWAPPLRTGNDSDQDRIGAWPEKFIFDTQLGPNRNGRHW